MRRERLGGSRSLYRLPSLGFVEIRRRALRAVRGRDSRM